MSQHEAFDYTYCAEQRSEVELIRRKYLPREEDKLERLRRLDRSVSARAGGMAITAGVLGTLLLGLGMSLCLSELGDLLGGNAMAWGIPIGLAGILLTAAALPIHRHTLRRERRRMAPEILRLTEELMK